MGESEMMQAFLASLDKRLDTLQARVDAVYARDPVSSGIVIELTNQITNKVDKLQFEWREEFNSLRASLGSARGELQSFIQSVADDLTGLRGKEDRREKSDDRFDAWARVGAAGGISALILVVGYLLSHARGFVVWLVSGKS